MSDSSSNLQFEKLKIGAKPKSVEFSGLPTDVLDVIIDKSELKERLVLRKVSRGLRSLVDQKKLILKMLSLNSSSDQITITYNGKEVIYTDPSFSFPLYITNSKELKVIRNEEYWKIAFDDLTSAIKDPTVQLDEFRVLYTDGDFFEKFKNILDSLDHQISTKKCNITRHFTDEISEILSFLKPGTLECIEIDRAVPSGNDLGFDQIVDLEQWKQATEFRMSRSGVWWPKENLVHFKRFAVSENVVHWRDLLEWRNFFSMSPNFEFAEVYTDRAFRPRDVQNHLGDVISTEDGNGNSMYIIHHPMTADSNQIMEIKVSPKIISFKKIARPSF